MSAGCQTQRTCIIEHRVRGEVAHEDCNYAPDTTRGEQVRKN